MPLIRIVLSLLIALFPVGCYCWFLGRVNRRHRPVVMSGVQDCAGLLLAASGFLLFIGPSILMGYHYTPIDVWLYNFYDSASFLGHRWWWLWRVVLWVLYIGAVAGFSSWLLWSRRRVTVVYNVEPDILDEALSQTLGRLGFSYFRSNADIFVAPLEAALDSKYIGNQVRKDASELILRVRSWPALRHATLHWTSDAERLRESAAPLLATELEDFRTPPHSVGTWFSAASALVFVLMFFLSVLFQLYNFAGVRLGM